MNYNTESSINIHTHQLSSSNEIIILNIPIGFENLSKLELTNQQINKSAGIHPWHIESNDVLEQLSLLEQMILEKQIFAIGEIGLDKACKTDFNLQIEVFKKQLDIAVKYKLPIIIHCVRAYNEVFEVLAEYTHSVKAVFHGFNSSKEMALQLCAKGYYLSIGDSLLNPKSKLRAFVNQIPLKNLFFETDESTVSIEAIYQEYCNLNSSSNEALKQQIATNFQQFTN